MAEIRLICPSCGAEYRVPDTAIPPDGREVECSACGNVWHATAEPGPAGTGDMPRLSRRLPDSVLDILRDEVEYERRARAAEDAAPVPAKTPAVPAEAAPPPAEAMAPPRPAADPEWPATTITRHVETRLPEPPPLVPRPVPKPQVFEMPPKSAAPVPARPAPEPAIMPVAEPAVEPTRPVQTPAPVPARGGYGAGFGLAAMLAAACVALYLLAPSLAGQGAFGEGVMQLRGQVDEARLWLQDRVAPSAR